MNIDGYDIDSMAEQLKNISTRVGLEFDYEKDDKNRQVSFRFIDKSVNPFKGHLRYVPYYYFGDSRAFNSIKKQIVYEIVDYFLM